MISDGLELMVWLTVVQRCTTHGLLERLIVSIVTLGWSRVLHQVSGTSSHESSYSQHNSSCCCRVSVGAIMPHSAEGPTTHEVPSAHEVGARGPSPASWCQAGSTVEGIQGWLSVGR